MSFFVYNRIIIRRKREKCEMKNIKKGNELGVRNFQNVITKSFAFIFLGVFLLIFASTVFLNSNDLIHFKMIRSFFIGGSILGILLLGFYIKDKNDRKFDSYGNKFKFIWIIPVIIFIVQVVIARTIYFEPGWDVSAIVQNAEFIVNAPEKFTADYFLMNPNNIFLLLVFSEIYLLSEKLAFIDFEFLLVIINIIIVDLSILLTILTAKRLFKSKVVIVTIMLFTLLFAFSPWIVIPYSDTLSMIFPIGIFYLYLNIKDKKSKTKKCGLLFCIGIFASIGYQIKPTIVIVLIAIVLVEFINRIKNFKRLSLGGLAILIIASGFLGFKTIYSKIVNNVTINGYNLGDRYDKEFPLTHYAMMGMQEVHIENRGTIYGVYKPEDVTYTDSFVGKDAKIKANIEEIKRRLSEFGPVGYMRFLAKKAAWFLSDGTFYYGGEGNFMVSDSYAKGSFAEKIQNIFLHDGDRFLILAHFFQGVWILMLFLIMQPLFRRNREKGGNDVFVIRLTITGMVMFLLFFEARSRYLINHISFFVLLAAYGFDSIYIRFLKELRK